jgi:hypothetical protein
VTTRGKNVSVVVLDAEGEFSSVVVDALDVSSGIKVDQAPE